MIGLRPVDMPLTTSAFAGGRENTRR